MPDVSLPEYRVSSRHPSQSHGPWRRCSVSWANAPGRHQCTPETAEHKSHMKRSARCLWVASRTYVRDGGIWASCSLVDQKCAEVVLIFFISKPNWHGGKYELFMPSQFLPAIFDGNPSLISSTMYKGEFECGFDSVGSDSALRGAARNFGLQALTRDFGWNTWKSDCRLIWNIRERLGKERRGMGWEGEHIWIQFVCLLLGNSQKPLSDLRSQLRVFILFPRL